MLKFMLCLANKLYIYLLLFICLFACKTFVLGQDGYCFMCCSTFKIYVLCLHCFLQILFCLL